MDKSIKSIDKKILQKCCSCIKTPSHLVEILKSRQIKMTNQIHHFTKSKKDMESLNYLHTQMAWSTREEFDSEIEEYLTVKAEFIRDIYLKDNKVLYKVKMCGDPLNKFEYQPETQLSHQLLKKFYDDYSEQLTNFYNGNMHSLLSQCSSKKLNKFIWLVEKAKKDGFKYTPNYLVKKWGQRKNIEAVAQELNQMLETPVPFEIENNVDLELFEINFEPLNKNKFSPDLHVDKKATNKIRCTCNQDIECKNQNRCCFTQYGAASNENYTDEGLVTCVPKSQLFECQPDCGCGKDCKNKVVQKRCQFRLSIFRTPDCRGWGVKALQNIPKGAFIKEYVGEIITNSEVTRRMNTYYQSNVTYFFDLDMVETELDLSIDATCHGNISRFVNHSCDPNLGVYFVNYGVLEPSIPCLALFTIKEVAKDEELTLDYNLGTNEPDKHKTVKCLCKSSRCIGYIRS